MTICAPCPYCGVNFKPILAANKRDTIAFHHPEGDCYLQSVSIGAALIPRFNRRSVGDAPGVERPPAGQPAPAPALFMTVPADDDGVPYPVFNSTGEGQPVTIKMVNDTISYYKRLAK